MKEPWIVRTCLAAAAILLCVGSAAWALTPQEELGKTLYFDQNLSFNKNQSCASCHLPPHFADPDNVANGSVVSDGSFTDRFGGRNSPSAAYAVFSPFFFFEPVEGLYMGGQFWDGRATTLKEQAKGPFLNPVEMAMPNKASVLAALTTANPSSGTYQSLFLEVYGVNINFINLSDPIVVEAVYDKMAEAIAAFEKTSIFRPFSSKYDYYLAGKVKLSKQEARGLELFNGKAQCNLCHPADLLIAPDDSPMPPLFTDYSYDNLGIPKSTNPLIAGNPVDYGLGGRPDIAAVDPDKALSRAAGYPVSAGQAGKFKVMTLRNIAATPPYGHNGFFATLEDIVHFYNARDSMGLMPEVAANVNFDELGNLGLTAQEEADIVAFLNTLTDGYKTGSAFNFPYPPSP
jgi:cytochrome c peroxidase